MSEETHLKALYLSRMLKLQNRWITETDEISCPGFEPGRLFVDRQEILDSLRSEGFSPRGRGEWAVRESKGQVSTYFEVELLCLHGRVKASRTYRLEAGGWEFMVESLGFCSLCDRYSGFGCPFCRPEVQSIRFYINPREWFCHNCGSKFAKANKRQG